MLIEKYKHSLLFAQQDYSFKSYEERHQDGKAIILRHDVDVSPWCALEMAKIENGLGIKATYFFLLDSMFYNLRWQGYADVVSQIRGLGHEIGLHVEYFSGIDIIDNIENFRLAVGIVPSIFSLHNPTKDVLNTFANMETLHFMINASYPFPDWHYISDSNNEDIRIRSENRIHLNLHPCWNMVEGKTRWAKISKCLYIADQEIMEVYLKERKG